MLTVEVPARWQDLLDIEDLETYDGPVEVEPDSVQRVQSKVRV